ncbi:uncharacterized protein MELLADRAFT_87000 [Melampsora larici-populina 98AG31]|uniref:Uncharacterized protein n=1 Tax=Melampsora larici-populina (strain 98AG31 / pathotype 3-4-7) TaxID=747676 RepID=F4R456_MELLP|nr:uncharacterized protein MELLADRAFT_87000 [Melampsora larici-populina 98AG31]EGG12744.1 hypothetical protein MELLADRAFT_87000 [Melampsora larici-populina 98AG31]
MQIRTAIESSQIALNLLPSGIAVPLNFSEGVDNTAGEFLNEAAASAQKLAFNGLFSSVLAGPTNESDEYVDVPVYLGRPSSSVSVDVDWLKSQLAPDTQLPIKIRQSPASPQVNSQELEVFSGFPSSLKEDSAFSKVSELLQQLTPGSIHHLELGSESTNGGKTACCLFGEFSGYWVGLIGCRVAT